MLYLLCVIVYDNAISPDVISEYLRSVSRGASHEPTSLKSHFFRRWVADILKSSDSHDSQKFQVTSFISKSKYNHIQKITKISSLKGISKEAPLQVEVSYVLQVSRSQTTKDK